MLQEAIKLVFDKVEELGQVRDLEALCCSSTSTISIYR